jgi:hypothetical protein
VGAEIVLFYFLPAGAALGGVCAIWVWWRSRRTGWARAAVVLGTFALGLLLPTLLLLAAGIYQSLRYPPPKLTRGFSVPVPSLGVSSAGAAARSNPLFQPTAFGGG